MDTLEGASTAERALVRLAEQRGEPITGSIELLPLCNMNCRMCYVRLTREEMHAQGRMRTGEEWLALGRQMRDAGVLFLLLTGGEPLLHPDFRAVYLGLKKLGMILTVNTNATLIDESWADFFAAHPPRRINITLYGADDAAYTALCRSPGTFDRVTNAVRLLRARGLDVKLSCSVTPQNVRDIPRMFTLARELDAPMHMDTYMMPAMRERAAAFDDGSRLSPEEAAAARLLALRGGLGEEFYSQYRTQAIARMDAFTPCSPEPCGVSCHAGKCSFTVNWQGKLRPCVVLTEPARPVFETGFLRAWQEVRSEFLQVRYCADCSACGVRGVCRVCTAAPLLETGDYLGKPEYLCRYARETARLLRAEEAHEHG